MVEQMLLASQRVHEADQVRQLINELISAEGEIRTKKKKTREVSSDACLSFLQSQAQGRCFPPPQNPPGPYLPRRLYMRLYDALWRE